MCAAESGDVFVVTGQASAATETCPPSYSHAFNKVSAVNVCLRTISYLFS